MKKILNSFPRRVAAFGTAALLAATFAFPAVTHAATNPTTPATKTTTTPATKKNTCGDKDLHCVITAGDKLFVERQTALKKLEGEVTTFQGKKDLTDAQAKTIQTNLSTNLTDITTLKTKFDAEKTVAAARQDIRELYNHYRIFAVVDPRESHEIHLDIEVNEYGKMVSVEPNLERLIAKAPAADQAKLKELYADYKAKLGSANTEIGNAQHVLPDLTVNNFNNNKGIYTASLKKLKDSVHEAGKDLHSAGADLHQLRKDLKIDK